MTNSQGRQQVRTAGDVTRKRVSRLSFAVLLAMPLLGACATRAVPGPAAPQEAFWASLRALCGQAFAGTLVEANPPDTVIARSELRMHVRQCSDSVIRVPFHVGDDRSRTWVVTRLPGGGLRLKHDHRHRDGSEDAITQYGGDTRGEGSATRQEFHADAHTASLIPAASTNVWTIEIAPGERYTYALRREGTDRRFRVDFDLTRAVPLPPAPWGSR